ncbi:cysteine synthase A [Rhizoclosmatium globosum]|uniref:Cysteine synthase A n=1 Tax=Rhizoclosmatium globosum TaxID=329046 RepID=A0A1Y2B0Y3_9FUNG|nr:cysteine synthase A [Rhizoclosmatium globosum]|eukprot:ORY28396.1 cysteine synthase A [Rhizoclosmatium globosum]
MLPDTAERYLSTPLFADISVESDVIEPAAASTTEVSAPSPEKVVKTVTTTKTTTVTKVSPNSSTTVVNSTVSTAVIPATPRFPIHQSVLSLIGRTPVVKINRLAPEGVNIYVKLESFNPLSSVKDRLALAVIEDAERRGLLKPGQTVVEATSGNTGIALAMVCAVKGYPFVATMVETFSVERRKIMKFLGAKVVLTPKELKGSGMVAKAEELAKEHGWFQTKQFANPANPEFHRQTTGPEILKDFAGKRLDYIVAGWGTGGTLTGVSAAVKAARPDVKVVAAEPAKAPLLAGGSFTGHFIQGWTPDFIPEVLDRNSYDSLVSVKDEDAIATSKLLAQKEGVFVGISSGATFAAALEVAKTAAPGSNILVMLPDTAERYLSTPLFADISPESDVIEPAAPAAEE